MVPSQWIPLFDSNLSRNTVYHWSDCDSHYTSESTSLVIMSEGQISHIPTSPCWVLFPGPKPQISSQSSSSDLFISPNIRAHENTFTYWTKVIDSWCSNYTMHGSYGNGTTRGEHHHCFTNRRIVSEWFRYFSFIRPQRMTSWCSGCCSSLSYLTGRKSDSTQ